MINAIFDTTSQVLEKSMDLRMMRTGLLASNIANAETRNYRAVDIDFKATMANLLGEMEKKEAPLLKLERSDPSHFSNDILENGTLASKRIVFAAGDSMSIGNDSNSVNLERQLGRLEQNTLQFTALGKLLGKKLAGIKNILESTSRF
jgi:flagellar basal-body rod protein FlgB